MPPAFACFILPREPLKGELFLAAASHQSPLLKGGQTALATLSKEGYLLTRDSGGMLRVDCTR